MEDIEDIVERLRSKATDCHEVDGPLYLEAANEIERLRKEVAVLEEEYGQPLIAPDIITKEAFASLGENLVPNPLWGRKV